ncbi:type II secretion system protein GspM [Oleiagrimonas sp. C23AA]|uniref:type II secretion system protein GspM n=1 Tax=Oleiagrimonas sp. C23AA TaxID=2719047 RepID=UPI0031B6DEB5
MGRTEQRLAAIGLALLTLALAYLALVHWWFVAPQQAISAQMRSLREDQHHYRALIAQKPMLQRRLAALAQGQARSSAFLPENDPSAASAGLMQHVVQAVKQVGGACEVTQKMPINSGDDDGGKQPAYVAVTVNISLRCGMHPLSQLLYRLEYGTPDLFVTNFSAYRNPTPRADGSLQPLEVQFALTGYVRPAAGGAKHASEAAP